MLYGLSGADAENPVMVDAVLSAPVDDPAAALAARRHFMGRVGVYAFLSFFAFIYILPLFVVVANSFRPSAGNHPERPDRISAQHFLQGLGPGLEYLLRRRNLRGHAP